MAVPVRSETIEMRASGTTLKLPHSAPEHLKLPHFAPKTSAFLLCAGQFAQPSSEYDQT
jgi:hypothetical protein